MSHESDTDVADAGFADDTHGTGTGPSPSPSSVAVRPQHAPAYYRDLYRARIDFGALAAVDADFAAFVDRGTVDFYDPAAVMALTVALLRRDFGLAMTLPSDRLCPPVPNRHAYVQWMTDLLACTGTSDVAPVHGADIGTGASCIYALLACAQHPTWHMRATDVDVQSLAWARRNVQQNGLQDRIEVVARSTADALVPLRDGETLAFTMTNPPFYASAAEMAASAAAKDTPARTACTGAPVEMVYASVGGTDGTDGGEVGFVGRIVAESVVLRERVEWYSAMLGKLASVGVLVQMLKEHGIDNYAVAALDTGGKTRRWALAWSFGARRPTVAVARGSGRGLETCRSLLPPITETPVFSVPAAGGFSAADLGAALDAVLAQLELADWSWDATSLTGTGSARENVWSRAWRRRKARQDMHVDVDADADPVRAVAFAFQATVRVGVGETVVGCRWTEGHDDVLYQSFCGFLKTKLKAAVLSFDTA